MREGDHNAPPQVRSSRRSALVPLAIGAGVLAILAAGAYMVWRAESRTNKTALVQSAKPVTVVRAKAAEYRASRLYVGTLEPWNSASVGPQLVAAYVDTVLVRPGAVVKRGEVIATLDCRNSSAAQEAVAMQARAIDARQRALAHEAQRVGSMLDGGFVSANEAEQKQAQSEAEQAQLLATKAKLLGTSLEVNDCVLRAPFDGEIATRTIDPGAFVRPGTPMVSIVDRTTVRVVANAPESDFDVVAPGTPVHIRVLATGKELVANIARRAPAADDQTRTVHFEIDVPDPDRIIPVATTAELTIDVGEPRSAAEVPLSAATVRGTKAMVFVVEGDVAHKRTVALLGERAGRLFLDPELAPGTQVVTQGRALLNDNDKVAVGTEPEPAPSAQGVKP